MGSIRSVLQSIDPKAANSRVRRDLVEALAKLADSQAKYFEQQLSNSLRAATSGGPDTSVIPISSVGASVTETCAYSRSEAGRIGKSIAGTLLSIYGGDRDDLLSQYGRAIWDWIEDCLRAESATGTTTRSHYLMTEGRSVIRFDVLAWQRDVEAPGLDGLVQKIGAFVAVKSDVDTTRMGPDAFRDAYSGQLASINLPAYYRDGMLAAGLDVHRSFASRAASLAARLPRPVEQRAPDAVAPSLARPVDGENGGAIRDVVRGVDLTTENGRIRRALAENLARLAESRAEFLDLRMSTVLRSRRDPATQVEPVLGSVTGTFAYSRAQADRIRGLVTSALRSLCGGSKDPIVSAVGHLISGALGTFLDDASARDTFGPTDYFVVEAVSIVRVYVVAWKLDVGATELGTVAEKICAFAVLKSAADPSDLTKRPFREVYSRQLAAANLDRAAQRDALEEAMSIHKVVLAGA